EPVAQQEETQPAPESGVRPLEVRPEWEEEESTRPFEPVAQQEETQPAPESGVRPLEVRPEWEEEESTRPFKPVAQQEETQPAPESGVRPLEVRPEWEEEESTQPFKPVAQQEETQPAPEPGVKEEEGRVASEPALVVRQVRLVPEPVAQQEEARPGAVPVVREEEIRPAPAPIARQPRNARSRKPGVLILVLLALFVGIIVGGVFGAYAVGHYRPVSVTSTPSPLPKATSSIHTPSPTRAATTPVALVGSYSGTIYNVATNATTKMSLTGIQQNQIAISGNFTGFNENAPFRGSIDTSRHIRFIVIGSSNSASLSFEGVMQTDGNLAGSYCILDPQGGCSGGYGVWSVAPLHAHG
ncbi:MAG: hypothetical protein ACJ8CB_15945, partial [Ktedonobacteraceae bacterium]